MANDNQANYAKIGMTVLLGIAAIVGTLVYLGGFRDRKNEILVETYFEKSVSGLSKGSVVNFRGVKIGEVREISFVGGEYDVSGADNSRIYVLIAIDGDTVGLTPGEWDDDAEVEQIHAMVVDRLGLRTMVTASGITGLSRIECDFYTKDPPEPMKISWKPRHFYIPSKNSLLDSFSDSATKVMNQINKMDFNSTWSNMNAMVESFAAISAASRNLVESRQGELDRVLADISAATEAARELAEKLRDNPSLLIREEKVKPLPETAR